MSKYYNFYQTSVTMRTVLFLTLAVASCLGLAPLRFDNYKVYRVLPTTLGHLSALRQLEKYEGFDFWTDISDLNKPVDIMVEPNAKENFENYLKNLNMNGTINIENVQVLIDNERSHGKSTEFDWSDYHDGTEINEWLRSLERTYPSNVKVVVGGTTYEGREILGVHVSFKSGNKGVFLEGGIHAREWIGPATVTFILNELLTSRDPSIRAVAESRDWYVFPSVNPDGYAFTKQNRMWRKTRSISANGCVGADPNRNWGYHWMEGGASSNPCSDTYGGSKAFSEIETRSLANFIDTIAANLDVYLAFHSYSQLLLIPFGHNGHEVPANNAELHQIGKRAVAELSKRYQTQYTVGNVPEVIYIASGGSFDWVLGAHRHIRLSYAFELRDTGRYGFLLPANQIIPTGQETLDAVVSMIQQVDGIA